MIMGDRNAAQYLAKHYRKVDKRLKKLNKQRKSLWKTLLDKLF